MNKLYKIVFGLLLIQLLVTVGKAYDDDDTYEKCCVGSLQNGNATCSGKIKEANKYYRFVCDDKEFGTIDKNSTLVCDECNMKATKKLVIILAVLIPLGVLGCCGCIGTAIYCCCKRKKEKKSHHNKLLNRY